ncbi:MAG: benzoate-CoA ligase family protein [Gemmatimonadota bacterium]
MEPHSIAVDRTSATATITFADPFNVAVPFIDRHVQEGRGAKAAIVGDFGEVTYAELAERVDQAGTALQSLGGSPGARVLLLLQDGPEFFYLFWGAIKAGFIPVPLNTLLRAADYRFIIEDSQCSCVLYSERFRDELLAALPEVDTPPPVMLPYEGDTGFAAAMARATPALEAAPAHAESPCFWLYSSGSTGRPKGVVHAHKDIPVTCVHYATGVLGLGAADICYSVAKLFFAYGLGNAMTFPLWVGATAVLSSDRPTPALSADLIERYRPTCFFGVPTLYAAQLRDLGPERDLSSVRTYVSAGEALPADILRRWKERTGCVILDGIGSTEILHIFISNTPSDYRPGSSGRVVPGYDAKVLDADGTEAAPGTPGALWIRGASVTPGYWNDPERTQRCIRDGWIDTGDTYVRDADGWFMYCGRNDDMLKVGGIWCSPFEIEAALVEHPDVLEAAVVGREDQDGLVKPEAFVVTMSAEIPLERLAGELRERCKSTLAPYKYPRWINFVPDLPKTATGKIQRFRLRP